VKILDRYITRWVLGGTALTLAGLLALFTFVSLVEQLGDVGKGRYGIWQAVEYVLLSIPRSAFEVFPMAALLGTLLGLGVLASHSELTVMRAAGVSIQRVVLAVLKPGAVLMLIVLVLGETLAPWGEELGHRLRSMALSDRIALRTSQGYWARDGMSFINIRSILSENRMQGLYVYEFDAQGRLRVSTYAREARYVGGHWLLGGVEQSEIRGDRVVRRELEQAEWATSLAPALVRLAAVSPARLSAWELIKYIGYLGQNGQETAPYELALWQKLMRPLITGVMIFLAVPVIFGPLRSVGLGQRTLVGAMIGLGFFLLNETASQMALVYELNPGLSATLPTAAFLALGIWLLRRVL
jgi:lipopolysaccharide export system permease protein